MKKPTTLICMSILLFSFGSVKGADLFTYNKDKTKKLSLNDVTKITFTASEINIVSTNEVKSVPFSDFHYFSFRPNVETNLNATSQEDDVLIFQHADLLVVRSIEHNVADAYLYSTRGDLLYKLTSDASEVSIPLSSYPAGIYILKMTINGKIVTRKIKK